MADEKLEAPETKPVGGGKDDDLDKVTGGLADDDVSDVAGGGVYQNHNETFLAAR